jgi:hypothetical protein
MSGVFAIWALMVSGITGCGGGSDSAAPDTSSGSATNAAPAATLTGSWNGSLSTGTAFSLQLTQSGDSITGTINISGNTHPVTGSLNGDAVSMTYTVPAVPPLALVFTTTATGNANSSRDTMAGNYTTASLMTSTSGTWSANK